MVNRADKAGVTRIGAIHRTLQDAPLSGKRVAPAGFLHMMLLSCRLLCEWRVGRLAPRRFCGEIGYICV